MNVKELILDQKEIQQLQEMGRLAMIVAVVDFKDRSSMSSNCYLNVCEM